MSYLLDTHALLWVLFSPKNLSPKVLKILSGTDVAKFVSAISLWEISLKYSIGKLFLMKKRPDEIPLAVKKMGFELLDINSHTAAAFYKLPILSHKDPFDLMLVWQAISQKYTLVSKDKRLRDYQRHGLKLMW